MSAAEYQSLAVSVGDNGFCRRRPSRREQRNAIDERLRTELCDGLDWSAGAGEPSTNADIQSALLGEGLAQSLLVGTADHAEGVDARSPRWAPAPTGR